MIYSEGLRKQHLAHMESSDLYTWSDLGHLLLTDSTTPLPRWLQGRYGAPFVWREAEDSTASSGHGTCFWMALMGEYSVRTHSSAIGLLYSHNGLQWHLLPERGARQQQLDGAGTDT